MIIKIPITYLCIFLVTKWMAQWWMENPYNLWKFHHYEFSGTILFEQNDKKQSCLNCLLVPKYSLFFKYGHFSCFCCLIEYRRYKFMFEQIFLCPICQQSCQLDVIYLYKVKKNNRPNSILMRMFKKAKFICSYAKCKSLILWKKFPITTCLNVIIKVFCVLHKVVNLLIMWKL